MRKSALTASMKATIASQAGVKKLKTWKPHIYWRHTVMSSRGCTTRRGATADAVSSDFLDLAQSVEHQELARLAATRLAERPDVWHIRDAGGRMASMESARVWDLHSTVTPLAIPDATTCVACQEQLELAGS